MEHQGAESYGSALLGGGSPPGMIGRPGDEVGAGVLAEELQLGSASTSGRKRAEVPG